MCDTLTMETRCAPAIIIAPPGLMRDSLKVVMEASGRITFVGAEDDWTAGLKMVAELGPKLVVVDTDGLGERFSWQTVQQLDMGKAYVPYCFVVHTREEEDQAKSAGAKIVLQAGFSTQAFFDAIAGLTSISSDDQSSCQQVPSDLIKLKNSDEPKR
jgi:DNA-binding NarL/FixJ family response regulator